MSETEKYKVMRAHAGFRFYRRGETRDLSASDAKHLVALGVLTPVADKTEAKAERVPANKAEKPLNNKAE